MEVISQNIANAEVSRMPDGKPYQRQQVVFETLLNQQSAANGKALPGNRRSKSRASRKINARRE